MANEALVTSGLILIADNLKYRTAVPSFRADVTGRKGPTPGAVTVPTTGVNVDLSQLTTPGLCVLKNLDAEVAFDWGLYDSDILRFFKVGRVLAGEQYVLRLHPELDEDYGSTGTGTIDRSNNVHLRLVAPTRQLFASVEAFEA